MPETITIVEAAQMPGIHRSTVVDLVRKGDLKGYKKTFARTSPFVVDRDSVLDFDRRRREQPTPSPLNAKRAPGQAPVSQPRVIQLRSARTLTTESNHTDP